MVEDMKVREGYKKTEVGIVPEDWEVVSLGEIGEPIIGLTYKPEDINQSGKLVLRSSNVQNNSLSFDDNIFVDTEVKEKLIVKKDDILICVRNGSRNLIGKCALIDERAIGSTFGAFMTLYRSDKSRYIFQYFQSYIIKKQIDENLGATINQITNKVLNSFLVAIPSNDNEERLIVKSLTDTDNLIHSIKNLIDKKEEIKKGTMQELLTGKKRLDGFSENNMNNEFRKSEIGDIPKDWNCTELNSIISNVRLGGNYTNSEEQSPYPLIKMGNLDRSKIKLDKVEYINSKTKPSNLDKLKYGDLLFNTRNTLTLVGKTSIWRNELPLAYYNSNILRLEFKNDYINSSFFMNYILNMQNSIVQLRNFATGTTSVAAIYTKDLMKLKVAIPTNVEEQKAISQVLSDMDQEIQGLKEKLEKYKTIKQAMMQELLTGRVRLI